MPEPTRDYPIELPDGTYTLSGETGKWDGPDSRTVSQLNKLFDPADLWSPPHVPRLYTAAAQAAQYFGGRVVFPPLPPLPPDAVP